MRLDPPLQIAAAITWLPAERSTVEQAVATGHLDRADAERNGFGELPVSLHLHAPEMASMAAAAALTAADWSADELDLVLHAWTHHQGHDFWSPAHFVASSIGAHHAVPIGIQQMCNGGAVALELAATFLQGERAAERVLVTTGDRFAAPAFDRWGGDYGIAYGDGATAVLLGGDRPSPLQLVAISTVAAPELEAMHRGDEPFDQTPAGVHPLNIRQRKKAFLAANGDERFKTIACHGARTAVQRALHDARVETSEVRCVALPRLGRSIIDTAYTPALATVIEGAAALNLANLTGHLGAGDVAANLTNLAHDDEYLDPGDVAVVLGAGAGFSWTCAIVSAT